MERRLKRDGNRNQITALHSRHGSTLWLFSSFHLIYWMTNTKYNCCEDRTCCKYISLGKVVYKTKTDPSTKVAERLPITR
jgi:hypothetical protein